MIFKVTLYDFGLNKNVRNFFFALRDTINHYVHNNNHGY